MFPFLKKEEKPVVVRFLFDGDQISYQDIKIIYKIQNGNRDPELFQLFMAHFMVNDKGAFLPEEQAVAILDRLKGPELAEVQRKFVAAFQEASIPNASGRPSSLHSQAGTPPPPSPDGPMS